MKQICTSLFYCLIVILISSHQGYGQLYDDPDAFYNRITHIFEHVDVSQVSTGLLLDYGIEFTDCENFNGITLTDTSFTTPMNWRELYFSLFSSKINTNFTLPDIETVSNDFKDASLSDTVVLATLHINYEAFRPDAVTANLMDVVGDQLYDVPGRPQSPYVAKVAFSIAPAKQVFFRTDHLKFVFDSNLFYTNTGKTISSLQVSTGGSYTTVYWDNPFTLHFSSDGIKTITFKINYTDASSFISKTNINLIDVPPPAFMGPQSPSPQNYWPSPSISPIPITASTAYQGGYGKGRMFIRYSSQNSSGVLKKPLIVAEGFDTWKILSPQYPSSNTDYRHFIDKINKINGFDLNHKLDDISEYDIIYLDYDNGTDYIQRNAYLLESVVQWVNLNKASTAEENVVLGISMGGLVARFALRDMEQNQLDHDTRLFISLDSPHQGANVPLGLQAMLFHLSGFNIRLGPILGNPAIVRYKLSDTYPYLGNLMRVLVSPAARQMLIYYPVATIFPGIEFSLYSSFMNQLHTKGYPTQTTNLAISSGSRCGIGQGYDAYAPLISYQGNTSVSYLLNFFGSMAASIVGAVSNKPLFILSFPLAVLSFKTSLYANFTVRALPDHQNRVIYSGQAGVNRKILGLINVNTNIINGDFYSSSSMLPLDNAPGGIYSLDDFGFDESLVPVDLLNSIKERSFCFVPTTSALDVGGGSVTLTTNDLYFPYAPGNLPSAPKDSPFSSIITANAENEIHTKLTGYNADWLYAKLEGISTTFNCPNLCQAISSSITGNSVLCPGTQTTYTLTGAPANTDLRWEIHGLEYVSGQGTTSITVKAPANGAFEIKAVLSTDCGTPMVVKDIWAGPPVIDYIRVDGDIYDSEICNWAMFGILNPHEATQWEWRWAVGTGVLGSPTSQATSGNLSSGGGVIEVRAKNICGWSHWTGKTIVVNCSNFSSSSWLTVANNPAHTSFTVMFNESDARKNDTNTLNEPMREQLYDVKLYSWNMDLVRHMTSVGENVVINTIDLPSHIYFLHVNNGAVTEKVTIIVNH